MRKEGGGKGAEEWREEWRRGRMKEWRNGGGMEEGGRSGEE